MINVTRSNIPQIEEYIEEIRELWDTRWITNMGIKHNILETKLKEYLKVKYITLFANGHLALENILEALIGGNKCESCEKEVITTPFTFASTTHAIKRCGLIPVFCDINENDYTINTRKIEKLISNKTVAIVPVHVYGNICDVETIEKIAKEHNLKVIYDAAHTFGETYKGIGIGNFGDASMFSFHATKVYNTIEGGAVCYKNEELIQKLNDLKDFGIRGTEEISSVGGNAKMDEFKAAMGICNLRHIDEEIEKRSKVVAHYRERFNGIKGIKLFKENNDIKYNYAYFPIVFDGYKYNRNEIYDKLIANDILSRKYFYPLTNSFEAYKTCINGNVDDTPIAKYISDRVLVLPLYGDLEFSIVDKICNIILQ